MWQIDQRIIGNGSLCASIISDISDYLRNPNKNTYNDLNTDSYYDTEIDRTKRNAEPKLSALPRIRRRCAILPPHR